MPPRQLVSSVSGIAGVIGTAASGYLKMYKQCSGKVQRKSGSSSIINHKGIRVIVKGGEWDQGKENRG